MSLRHQALLYDGTDEFLAAAVPFVREGVEAGDPVIAVAHRHNVDALRESLGADAARVDLRESSTWYLSPARSFSGFIGFAAAHPEASCVRMIGEPIWPVGWDAAVAEYAHYEAVFNVVGKDAPIRALCPYDVDTLPDVILDHARATHPELHEQGESHGNDAFVDPDAYSALLAGRPMPIHARARRYEVTPDLSTLRAAVAAEAAAAGVPAARLGDLVLALHEVAANAVSHGGGTAVARTWLDERSFVCEVENSGPTISETTAGYLPPDRTRTRGRGLWLARQTCDLVEIRSRGGKTKIRLHVARA